MALINRSGSKIPSHPPGAKSSDLDFNRLAYITVVIQQKYRWVTAGKAVSNFPLLIACVALWCIASLSLVNIGSGNGLSPVRRQAITWTNFDLLSIAPHVQTSVKFDEIRNFLFNKLHLKMSFTKCRPFYSVLNVF